MWKKLSQTFCLWRKNDKYHIYVVCRDHIRKDVMTQCSMGVCGLCVAAHVCSPRLSVAAVNIIWKLFLDAIASPSTYLPSEWVSEWVSNVFRFWRDSCRIYQACFPSHVSKSVCFCSTIWFCLTRQSSRKWFQCLWLLYTAVTHIPGSFLQQPHPLASNPCI